METRIDYRDIGVTVLRLDRDVKKRLKTETFEIETTTLVLTLYKSSVRPHLLIYNKDNNLIEGVQETSTNLQN